jgi:hypothetical protein
MPLQQQVPPINNSNHIPLSHLNYQERYHRIDPDSITMSDKDENDLSPEQALQGTSPASRNSSSGHTNESYNNGSSSNNNGQTSNGAQTSSGEDLSRHLQGLVQAATAQNVQVNYAATSNPLFNASNQAEFPTNATTSEEYANATAARLLSAQNHIQQQQPTVPQYLPVQQQHPQLASIPQGLLGLPNNMTPFQIHPSLLPGLLNLALLGNAGFASYPNTLPPFGVATAPTGSVNQAPFMQAFTGQQQSIDIGSLLANANLAAATAALAYAPSQAPPTSAPLPPLPHPSHASAAAAAALAAAGALLERQYHHGPAQASSSATPAVAAAAAVSSSDLRGPIPISMEFDEETLSEYQCLLRKQMELFEAGPGDIRVSAQGRNTPILLGQVGLRCRHCATLPLAVRRKGAVYYSQTIDGIYQIAQNMGKVHLCNKCDRIPTDVQTKLQALRSVNQRAACGKRYWSDGVRALGVYQDGRLLRFHHYE